MKISILIPTLNNVEFMKMAVRSYRNHTVNPHEILVYANAMTPGMKEYARKENFDVFQFSSKNEGIAKATNSLAKQATGDIIHYTNDDIYVAPGWDVGLVKKLNDDIFYQYLTACMFERIGVNPTMNAPFDYGDSPENWREKDFLNEWWDKRLIKEDISSGRGPVFITKELWDSIGGFDEGYYPGLGTDPDITAKIYFTAKKEEAPWEFRGVADSGVYHFQARTVHLIAKPHEKVYSHTRFKKKWGLEIRDFLKLTRQGEKLYGGVR